jgi:hypothetical protein
MRIAQGGLHAPRCAVVSERCSHAMCDAVHYVGHGVFPLDSELLFSQLTTSSKLEVKRFFS